MSPIQSSLSLRELVPALLFWKSWTRVMQSVMTDNLPWMVLWEKKDLQVNKIASLSASFGEVACDGQEKMKSKFWSLSTIKPTIPALWVELLNFHEPSVKALNSAFHYTRSWKSPCLLCSIVAPIGLTCHRVYSSSGKLSSVLSHLKLLYLIMVAVKLSNSQKWLKPSYFFVTRVTIEQLLC